MYKLRTGIAGLVAVLFLTPGVVLAKNYCITGFPNSAYVLVGLGFKVPGKGKCKAWTGFNLEGNVPTAGTGCTSSDGSDVSLTLTTGSLPGGFVEIDTIRLSLPSQTGEVGGQALESSAVSSFGPIGGIVGEICNTQAIPAAVERGSAAPRPGDDSAVR